MRTSTILTGLVLCAAVATGCGEDGGAPPAKAPEPVVDLAERQAAARPGPVRPALRGPGRQGRVGGMTRRVQYALADDAKIPGLNRLRASQSIFFAITEVCKGKPGSYKPARPAIAGVRSGEYLADLGSP